MNAHPRSRQPSTRFATLALAALAAGCAPASEPMVTAPETFVVGFETSAGPFEIEFVRAWSPIAVDRVFELVGEQYWEGARIYRVNERYAQFGFSGQPALDSLWIPAGIPDEQVLSSNVRGSVSFARGGPGTRSSILFVNRSDNTDLDDIQWNGVTGFPPVGRVVSGMESIDGLYGVYGDAPMAYEDSISLRGNAFFDRAYPELDTIGTVTLAPGTP